jgi:dipeptidyl aminopeptidase/acylaminoacyl peptidase
MINPHGSVGQGQAYINSVRGDMGGAPYNDLMNGIKFVAQRYNWVNVTNACAAGGSYGGYMVNLIQGKNSNFKCLVTHDGDFSEIGMYYSTDELWFPMTDNCPDKKWGCAPWDPQFRGLYEKHSPEKYVKNWKTPHLVIHGGKDYRIPITEALSVFSALQLKKIPSRLIYFAEENHWVLRPENSIKWYQEVLGWFDKYTQNTK